jgi:HD-like signal output (HDOD) protein
VSNLDQWTAFLCQVEIPVLRSSVDELARLEQNEDNITARDISGVILRDPMLTLRVLRYLPEYRRNRRGTEITTVGHAVMMLGITPFFRQFRDMKVVEDVLAECPHAMEGFLKVVNRARHAALHAREWAALRHDIESDEVIIAALLHDVAEMLLWCLAPECATQIAARLRQDKALRSAVAQESVLGFRLMDLQLALLEKWRLPALLQSLMDDDHSNPPRARIVAMAIALARHSANGWDDPALSDDYAAIRKFLALSERDVMTRIHRVALSAIRRLERHGELPSAAWLPPTPAAWADTGCDGVGEEDAAGRPAVVRRTAELLTVRAAQDPDFLETLSLVLHGMHAGVGLDRVLFMAINDAHDTATAKYVTGSREAFRLQKFQIDLACPHVFSRLVTDGTGVWYRAAAGDELPAVPLEISKVIGNNEFFAMAIAVNGNPIGLIYADGGCHHPVLDAGQYEEFQTLCLLLATALGREPQTGHFL